MVNLKVNWDWLVVGRVCKSVRPGSDLDNVLIYRVFANSLSIKTSLARVFELWILAAARMIGGSRRLAMRWLAVGGRWRSAVTPAHGLTGALTHGRTDTRTH